MYPYIYIYKEQKNVLIWETSERGDVFKTDSQNKLIKAGSEEELEKQLSIFESTKIYWNESATINFDKFWQSLNNLKVGRASSVNTCKTLLDGWNFIEDLLRTFKLDQEQKYLKTPILNKAYKKLVSGCNLPSITPEGKSYSPLWKQKEITELRKALKTTWLLLRQYPFYF